MTSFFRIFLPTIDLSVVRAWSVVVLIEAAVSAHSASLLALTIPFTAYEDAHVWEAVKRASARGYRLKKGAITFASFQPGYVRYASPEPPAGKLGFGFWEYLKHRPELPL